MSSYRNQPCAYCGAVTHQNQGEHILPSCFYPESTDPKIQRAKISSCRVCNGEFSKDEAQFRAILTLAGLNPTPERYELWPKVKRSFEKEKSGKGDLFRIVKQMYPKMIGGKQYYEVYPAKDAAVMKIVRKIIRGLSVYTGFLPPPVADDRIWADVMKYEIPPAFEDDLKTVYEVPNLAICRAAVLNLPDSHSVWVLKLLEVPFIGGIDFKLTAKAEQESQGSATGLAAGSA